MIIYNFKKLFKYRFKENLNLLEIVYNIHYIWLQKKHQNYMNICVQSILENVTMFNKM